MNKLALALAVLALAVGGVAYWRSGGEQDIATARREMEHEIQNLRAKQKELADKVSAMLDTAYETLEERLRRVGEPSQHGPLEQPPHLTGAERAEPQVLGQPIRQRPGR